MRLRPDPRRTPPQRVKAKSVCRGLRARVIARDRRSALVEVARHLLFLRASSRAHPTWLGRVSRASIDDEPATMPASAIHGASVSAAKPVVGRALEARAVVPVDEVAVVLEVEDRGYRCGTTLLSKASPARPRSHVLDLGLRLRRDERRRETGRGWRRDVARAQPCAALFEENHTNVTFDPANSPRCPRTNDSKSDEARLDEHLALRGQAEKRAARSRRRRSRVCIVAQGPLVVAAGRLSRRAGFVPVPTIPRALWPMPAVSRPRHGPAPRPLDEPSASTAVPSRTPPYFAITLDTCAAVSLPR